MERLVRISKRLGLLALAYLLVLAGTYIYCELAEPPGIRVDQAAKPLLSPAERAALHPDTRAGLEAYETGDYTRAHALWLPRAEAGDAEAMFGMGRIYGNGRGVEQDDIVARGWFEQAAQKGHPWSQYSYARYLANGIGGLEDRPTAFRLYEKAAHGGIAWAAYNLGNMHRDGHTGFAKVDNAFAWYLRAARQCEPWALMRLSAAYFDGIGTQKDEQHSYTLTTLSLLNDASDRWKIHLLYLVRLTPWDYMAARREAWVRQISCVDKLPLELEP